MIIQTFEQARRYLARVVPWPQEGEPAAFLNVHWTFKGEGHGRPMWTGRATRSVKEAVNAVEFALTGQNTKDVYLCLSSQSTAKERTSAKGHKYLAPVRSQDTAVALKSFFIDIDIKPDKGYATMDDAVSALASFLQATNLPKPNVVVSSGGGLHVYWVVSRPMALDEWRPIAFALAEATKHHGLKCDTQCTVDGARVLRIPNTFNRKLEAPRPVKLTSMVDFDYSVERIASALEPYKTITPSHSPQSNVVVDPALFPARAPIKDDELSAGVDSVGQSFVDLLGVIPQCGFIREAVSTGGKDYTNPLWNLTTLIATFADHGRVFAHKMARGHPGYTKESTDELYDRKEREKAQKGLGWPSCKTISASGCSACQACPHFSAGKSPLHLVQSASRQRASGVHPGVGTPITQVTSGVSAPVTSNDLPDGYTRRPDGIIMQQVPQDDGSFRGEPLCEYVMDDAWLQDAPPTLHFTTIVNMSRKRQIDLPAGVVGGNEMRALLQTQLFMVPVGAKRVQNLSEFFVAWIKKLQDTKETVSSSPFGWHVTKGIGAGAGGLEGFVFAGRMYTPTGEKLAANPDNVIARHYAPTGQMAPWSDAAKMITDQSRQDLCAIVASAFAAPLVRFTGHPGVIMSAYSQESGIGKSTALKVAQAVWGDPVGAVQSLSDTANSVMHKLGEIRNLPLYWDELKTDEDTRKFVNITFQTTQGKEKSRLTSRVTQREPGRWQTLLVSASNDSLLDYIINHTNTTTAGLYRIFQYIVKPAGELTPGQIDTSVASLITSKLNDNYGQVGLEYAKFLGASHARVSQEVADFALALGKEVDTHPDERFWLACITTICVGARYANELGFAVFDEVALKAFMLDVLASMRAERNSQPVDMGNELNVVSRLGQFLKAMQGKHTLRTNRIHIGRGKPLVNAVKVIGDPTRLDGLSVHIGMEDKMLRISSGALHDWLREKSYPQALFVKALVEELGMRKMVGRLGSGTSLACPTEYLFEFDLTTSDLLNFIDEA